MNKMILPISIILLATASHSSGFSWKHYLNSLANTPEPDPPESWKGRWFPDKPPASSDEPSPVISENSMIPARSSQDYLVDDSKNELTNGDSMMPHQRLTDHLQEMMSMQNGYCDDAKTNLTLDFDPDEAHFVCHSRDIFIQPQFELPSILTQYTLPPAFYPSHRCMNVSIEYPSSPPTYGNHRPHWAKWGEYEYLPPQRWVHNLEHGGIVMLYNPCAHHFLVNRLKEIVRKCLYKHVITPYRLPSERPLALVAWGWSLAMSDVNEEAAKKFIEDRANRGPEMIDGDGKYDLYLKRPASDFSKLGQGICSQI